MFRREKKTALSNVVRRVGVPENPKILVEANVIIVLEQIIALKPIIVLKLISVLKLIRFITISLCSANCIQTEELWAERRLKVCDDMSKIWDQIPGTNNPTVPTHFRHVKVICPSSAKSICYFWLSIDPWLKTQWITKK